VAAEVSLVALAGELGQRLPEHDEAEIRVGVARAGRGQRTLALEVAEKLGRGAER